MRTIKLIALALVLGLFSNSASAQKIGYMNYGVVLNLHPSYDTAVQVLTQFENEWNNKLEQQNAEFEKKYEEFVILSQTEGVDSVALENKRATVISLKNDLDYTQETAKKQYNTMQQTLVQAIYKKINVVVEEIAKEKGMTYVMDNSTGLLIVKDPKGDITKEVLTRLGLEIPAELNE